VQVFSLENGETLTGSRRRRTSGATLKFARHRDEAERNVDSDPSFWLHETPQRHTHNGVSPLRHAAIRDFAAALRSLRWFVCGYDTIGPQDWINVNVVPQRAGS
jgi:hypothetical protein